jgi:hypothetical protein
MLPFAYLYQGIIVPASVTIPIGTALSVYSRTSPSLRSIFVYLVVAGITNVIAAALAFRHMNNLPFLHVYTVVELLLLLRFFYLVLPRPQVRKVIRWIAIVFPVMAVLNFLFLQHLYTFNSYIRPLEAIILILLSMLFLNQQVNTDPSEERTGDPSGNDPSGTWSDKPEFWIVVGLLLYFSSSFFQFAFSNIVSRHASFATRMVIWNIHASLVLVMYLLFAVAFIKCKR